MIDQERQKKNEERFRSEILKVTHSGIDKVIDYIANDSDFFIAPTSSRFHLCVPGGLLQHSLNVLDALRSILTHNSDGTYSYCVNGVNILKKNLSDENVIVMALLHDICKTRFYKTGYRNKKNAATGKWETCEVYEVSDTHPFGHGEGSVIMLLSLGLKLEQCELYAIRWHMGPPEGNDRYTFDSAVEKYPEVWALHSADMMAAHFMEEKEDNFDKFIY